MLNFRKSTHQVLLQGLTYKKMVKMQNLLPVNSSIHSKHENRHLDSYSSD